MYSCLIQGYSSQNPVRDCTTNSLSRIALFTMLPVCSTADTLLLLLVLLLICPSASSSSPLPSSVSGKGNSIVTTGSVVCLTNEARELLVESCHKRALIMGRYEHVSTCFGKSLDRLTDVGPSNLGFEPLTCLDDKQILDALVNCAYRVDREDIPRTNNGISPVKSTIRFFTDTMQSSLKTSSALRLASATKFAQSLVSALTSTARLQQPTEGFNYCNRKSPCCLMFEAGQRFSQGCFRRYCGFETSC